MEWKRVECLKSFSWRWSRGWFLYLRREVDRTWPVDGCWLLRRLACILRTGIDRLYGPIPCGVVSNFLEWLCGVQRRPIRTRIVWSHFELSGTTLRCSASNCMGLNNARACDRPPQVRGVVLCQPRAPSLVLWWSPTAGTWTVLKYIIYFQHFDRS